MNPIWQNQQQRITKLSRDLRIQYYNKNRNANCYFDTPSGVSGNLTESIGSWPEFIFRGTFCKRTFQGLCSPCFYSQFPIDPERDNDQYNQMVKRQYDYIINNFQDLVIARQFGKTEHGKVKFVLTPTGSFFDEKEFPQSLRIDMLSKLVNAAFQYNVEIALYVECHCKDWNALNTETSESKYEIALLKKLNATLLFGFESADDYVRNVLYNKNLPMDEFNKAFHSTISSGLKAGIFIFAGLFSMNDSLTIKDVCSTIDFALDNKITPVLMFQNIQQNTITDLLYRNQKIALVEPFAVMDIILHLLNRLEKCSNQDWLIADPKGGPPVPEHNIFDCSIITSKSNSDYIYNMICDLRLSRDGKAFKEQSARLMNTSNYMQYKHYLEKCVPYDALCECTEFLLASAEALYKQQYGEEFVS